jgi:hypothetical protein
VNDAMKKAGRLATAIGAVVGLLTTMAPAATTAFAATEPLFPNTSDAPVYVIGGGSEISIPAGTQLDWAYGDEGVLSSKPQSGAPADHDEVRLPAPSAKSDELVTFISAPGDERTPSKWKAYADRISFDAQRRGALYPTITPYSFTYGAIATVKSLGGTYSAGVAYTHTNGLYVDNAYYTALNIDAGTGGWTFATPKLANSSTTTLTVDRPSVAVNDSVTLTAHVTVGDDSAATGSVTFFEGTSAVGGPVTVTGGVATTTVPVTTAGNHSYTASFTPSGGGYTGSTSRAVSVTAGKAATATSLAASATSVTAGASVTLTATVTPATATGSVLFYDGATALGSSVALSGGSAAKRFTVTAGTHSYTAKYAGSSALAASTSAAVTVTVTAPSKRSTTTSLSARPTSVTTGAKTTLAATVTPSAATGRVQFYEGAKLLGSGSLSGGKASLVVTVGSAGSHSYTAKFVANDTYRESTSAVARVTATSKKFAKTAKPTISGTAKVGNKLTAKVKAWSPKATFKYQWFAGGKAIKAATKPTYQLAKSQKGKTITVKVTGSATGYLSVSLTSKATARVR